MLAMRSRSKTKRQVPRASRSSKKPRVEKKKPEPKRLHPEVKGIFFLGASIVGLVSLLSFSHGSLEKNWLGLVGYSISYFSQYIFGLGSYLICGFFAWVGWNFLTHKIAFFPKLRSIYFSIFLASSCLLLNVISDVAPVISNLFASHVISETSITYQPIPQVLWRYNLGGVPLYYLYKDLPYFHLEKLLSPIGVALIFSITGLGSFLLLTGVQIVPALQNLGRRFIELFPKMALAIGAFFREFRLPKKQKDALPQPQILKPKIQLTTPLPPEPTPQTTTNTEPTTNTDQDPVKIHTLKSYMEATSKQPEKKSGFLKSSFSSVRRSSYKLPPPTLLTNPKKMDHPLLRKDLERQAQILEETLKSFGIGGKVVEIHCGPTITSFEVQPPIGVKVQKIKTLQNDIALNLQAKSIRIIAPIPGKAAVGVEIPALQPQEVNFKEMLYHYQKKSKQLHIPILLGKTVHGENVIADLIKMPHCLIAGATGSGKSVCVNAIVMSILMNASPDEVKLIMIDPKKVELTQYSNLPHMIAPVISEAHGAYAALQWLVREMQVRYDILKQLGLRNISAFNRRKPNRAREEELHIEIPEKMPMIVAIIDEFADLMMVSSSDLETPIARIAQMARAVGIHLILATQRPSREVITGIIKANFPSRIAFKVASRINSQIILDETGAESLLGNGDLLFLPPGSSQLVRAQGVYVSDEDINKCVEHICSQAPTNYLISSFDAMPQKDESDFEPKDELYDSALQIVVQTKNASTTFLQRKLKIGYARAASLIDELEENGVVGPQEGSRARKVLKNH